MSGAETNPELNAAGEVVMAMAKASGDKAEQLLGKTHTHTATSTNTITNANEFHETSDEPEDEEKVNLHSNASSARNGKENEPEP